MDLLVVMGGPMGVGDRREHPWLDTERTYLRAAIQIGKPILGICLGAQLLADVLGGKVEPNPNGREIGWYDVHRTDGAAEAFPPLTALPERFEALHWHGDHIVPPPDAVPLLRNDATEVQAFSWHDRVLGLQFHLEMGAEGLVDLIHHCGADLESAPSPHVQDAATMLGRDGAFEAANDNLFKLLDAWVDHLVALRA